MKSLIFYLTVLIIVLICSIELNYSGNINISPKKIKLDILNISWITNTRKTPSLTFGFVELIIKGKTNAERLTITTYGDGLRRDEELKLDSIGIFDDTIGISFTHNISLPRYSTTFYSKTVLKAYLGSNMIDTTLMSGPLQFKEN